jgi:hypothetical protein
MASGRTYAFPAELSSRWTPNIEEELCKKSRPFLVACATKEEVEALGAALMELGE